MVDEEKQTPPQEEIPDEHLYGTEENPIVVKPEKPFEKPKELISWQAYSRSFKNRTPSWFVGLGVVTLITIFILITFFQFWTLSLAIMAFFFMLISLNLVEPEHKTFIIMTTGVKLGKKRFGYEDLKWFWFEEEDKDEEHTILYISTFLNYPHLLEMPLPSENSKELENEIETKLLKYLPYNEEGDRNWMDRLDSLIYRLEPYLPQYLIEFYRKNIG